VQVSRNPAVADLVGLAKFVGFELIGLWPEISWPSSAITATANGSSSPFRAPADLT
jgi:hypothetical protein